jgi:hypothetical protein
VPEGSNESTNTVDFGLSLERFEAAVNSLVGLRDKGRLLIFLTRRGSVKLIGEIEDFRKEFSDRARDEAIDLDQSKRAQNEIRRLTAAIIRYPDPDSVVDYLERFSIEEFAKKDQSLRDEYRRRQRLKIDLVSQRIVTEAMRHRAKRLATAIGACVEELDFEVISTREDAFRGRSVKDSFLRLRLRYSEIISGDIPFFLFIPYEETDISIPKGFEFECDLSDLDLLLKRLGEAKQWLLRIQASENEER